MMVRIYQSEPSGLQGPASSKNIKKISPPTNSRNLIVDVSDSDIFVEG